MSRVVVGCFGLLVFVFSAACSAQEFRVYTQVWDLNFPDPVARSLTLWHAGKVYDVLHSAGEVTILEPAHRRFTIINSDQRLLTTVDFEELKHSLQVAENQASKDVLDRLRFQLHPQFKVTLEKQDSQTYRLLLAGRQLTYDVRGDRRVEPEILESYLEYADWTCRLNYVLHPQPVFPTARLQLNSELRKSKLFPAEVALRAQFDQPLNLKAEHKLDYTLNSLDRQSIHKWESQLRDPKMQKVAFAEYQRALLSQQTAKSR